MSVLSQMTLATGEMWAERIAYKLNSFCERIEVAGSIRRRRPRVNDVDLVIIPKDRAGLRAVFESANARFETEGQQNWLIHLPLNGSVSRLQAESGPTKVGTPNRCLQIDIFFAQPRTKDLFTETPSTWGTVLLCRTGSMAHNIFLADRARSMNLHWNPYRGVFDDEILLASETEEDIFKVLKLDFVPPERRER